MVLPLMPKHPLLRHGLIGYAPPLQMILLPMGPVCQENFVFWSRRMVAVIGCICHLLRPGHSNGTNATRTSWSRSTAAEEVVRPCAVGLGSKIGPPPWQFPPQDGRPLAGGSVLPSSCTAFWTPTARPALRGRIRTPPS